MEQALHTEFSFLRKLGRMLFAGTIVGPVALTPEMSAAEGLFDFFFGGGQKQQQQTSSNKIIRNHHRSGLSSQARDLPSACAVATANIFR